MSFRAFLFLESVRKLRNSWTAYLSASAAQVHRPTRHVRFEHDVTIHTSDGLWLATPVLHWMPDEERQVLLTDVAIGIHGP